MLFSIVPHLMLEIVFSTIGRRKPAGAAAAQLRSRRTPIAFKVKTSKPRKTYLRGQWLQSHGRADRSRPGPCATTRVNYVLDPWGISSKLVEYTTQAFEASAPVKIYRP